MCYIIGSSIDELLTGQKETQLAAKTMRSQDEQLVLGQYWTDAESALSRYWPKCLIGGLFLLDIYI